MANRTTSVAKVEANRRNAQKSTGPRTLRGKNTSRWNAVKHGLLSGAIVIEEGDGREDRKEFDALLVALRRECQPEGVLEEMLVERIAVCYWRLRRVLRCEVGEIRARLDSVVLVELTRRADSLRWAKRFAELGDPGNRFLTNSLGFEHLIDVLRGVRARIDEIGYVPEEAQKELLNHFGSEKYGVAHLCYAFGRLPADATPAGAEEPDDEGALTPTQRRGIVLGVIDKELERLSGLKVLVEKNEELELAARAASFALPPKDAADKILRYETTIERALYRAISQLERLQRQRHGDAVPPPISIELSGQA